MGINDSYADANVGLADATDWVVDGSDSGTGAVNITEIGGSAAGEIYREQDTNGDGEYDYRTLIDGFTGGWHTQGNDLLVSTNEDVRLVIRNVSEGEADFGVVGYEVDN